MIPSYAEEGAIFIVIGFPGQWPVPAPAVLVSDVRDSSAIQIHALPNGCIHFTVKDGDQTHAQFTSQEVSVNGTGYAILDITWTSTHTSMRLNQVELLDFCAAAGQVHTVMLREYIAEAQPSYLNPRAVHVCRQSMEWRKHRYSSPKPAAKQNRRLKTEAEQVMELANARMSLADLATSVQEGKQYLLGHLATELRALIYWNGKSYSPLLLRLAGRLELPLPIYFVPSREKPKIVAEASLNLRSGTPSMLRRFGGHTLGDLQEWLNQEVLTCPQERYHILR